MCRAPLVLAALALSGTSCSFDTDRAAPHVASTAAAGACGTTETLLPKLLAFVREDRFRDLRTVLERRLLPTDAEPAPDPSLRTLIGAAVRLLDALGLDRARVVADLLAKGELEEELSPLVVTVLRFGDGQLDGAPRYESANATAFFLRRCDPENLLTAVEGLLRFESPSHGVPWIQALADEAGPLLREPTFQPFLDSFEREAAQGRPAIVALLTQVMLLVGDEGFTIDRVETLLESAVYPAVRPELRARIEVLVRLLDEITRPDVDVLRPLQAALRCGLAHPEEKDALAGFLYDLVASEELGLAELLDTASGLVTVAAARAQLGLFADAVHIVRTDLEIRDELVELVAILLSSPDVELVVPVLIELLDRGVVAELFEAAVVLLDGCGRP